MVARPCHLVDRRSPSLQETFGRARGSGRRPATTPTAYALLPRQFPGLLEFYLGISEQVDRSREEQERRAVVRMVVEQLAQRGGGGLKVVLLELPQAGFVFLRERFP